MELLANTLRPKTIKEVLGQSHLIGKDKLLTNLVKNKKIFNMILYGKSGTGKTTIALALMNDLNVRYRLLNATINSKKDFEVVVAEAKMYEGIILIVDELHRMNKDKQDLLLSYIESGLITLIGLTNSNPYHTVNKAIRSRCQVVKLNEISDDEMLMGLKRVKNVYKDLKLSNSVYKFITSISKGDIRYAYNLIEFCYYGFGKTFTIDQIKEINLGNSNFFDKNEDGHYDLLSAFQKSIRGSDVNASLYYLVLLINSGDFESIYRRMLVIVYEDIGLANPTMPNKVLTAITAAERLGLPELYKPLSAVIIDMALSPKSNSVESSYSMVLKDIEKGNIYNTPDNIKTNSLNYLYPHAYPNNYVKQQYLPTELLNRVYYKPGNNKYEMQLNQYDENRKK